MTAAGRRLPWSLLQTQWLDVPVGLGVERTNPTWGAFSEDLGRCLEVVSAHVRRRVRDRACLEDVLTDVVVENLHLLVLPLGEREKLDRLLAAADLLITRRAGLRSPSS